MAKDKVKLDGVCALSGEHGRYVKSHIIPQAFTKPTIKGAPLYQSTRGMGEARRWSSWYDPSLVTRKGEDILSEIDSNAVRILRRHQLVWSGWMVFRPHFESMSPLLPEHSYRIIKIVEVKRIIQFALSIAWRASASRLRDLTDVKLEANEEEILREIVLGGEFSGSSPFPVSIIQISTQGVSHNQSPYLDRKVIPDFDGSGEKHIRIMRIYMDGLIFHIHFDPIEDRALCGNPLYLGEADEVFVTAVSHAASFQYENMLHLMRECYIRR